MRAIGCTAEQMSCTKPGRVSSPDRVPPPMVGAASTTSTRHPARPRVAAAVSPFGPAPTTTASHSSAIGHEYARSAGRAGPVPIATGHTVPTCWARGGPGPPHGVRDIQHPCLGADLHLHPRGSFQCHRQPDQLDIGTVWSVMEQDEPAHLGCCGQAHGCFDGRMAVGDGHVTLGLEELGVMDEHIDARHQLSHVG